MAFLLASNSELLESLRTLRFDSSNRFRLTWRSVKSFTTSAVLFFIFHEYTNIS